MSSPVDHIRPLSGRLKDLCDGEIVADYITPLFWLHGESQGVLLEEIERMHSVGVRGFILESRPFPEFLNQPWWDTVEYILTEAEKRGLKVFIFDDVKFPSGFAAGRIGGDHPEYLKLYLRENCLDAIGPLPGASFQLGPWLIDGEKIIRVVVAPVSAGDGFFDGAAALDVTCLLSNDSVLAWDVPPGHWRMFLYVSTRDGGEAHTRDYINPINPLAVRAYLDEVYEPHFQKFGKHFGKTLQGFFSDEPRFGSAESYEATLGRFPMVIPFSDELMDHLDKAWGGDFTHVLPCLWHDGGESTARARLTYMDVVSRLYAQSYTQQIGDWCRAHDVSYIGHVVEDNGAHARLGYGTGHFFRALHGQDWSGLDAVLLQLLPEYNSGKTPTPFGPPREREYCSDFFYWGVTKLAASAGHLDPKKKGITFAEAFGAYGWSEGLKLMMWLTNHFCVRGVNHFVPHAFSPQEFPDVDCPPHFYARGNNPQWPYFKIWADYANRICHLLSGGRHIASVAVVYHAEAEWMGQYDPFEKVVKVLSQRQIDCDIVPIDLLLDRSTSVSSAGELTICEEVYPVIVVPYAEFLPGELVSRLEEFANLGVNIVFMKDMPTRAILAPESGGDRLDSLRAHERVSVTPYEELADLIVHWDLNDIRLSSIEGDLRYYHYANADEDIYFFVNESTMKTVDTKVRFRQMESPIFYKPLDGSLSVPEYIVSEGGLSIELFLEPYESTFVIFSKEGGVLRTDLPLPALIKNLRALQTITGPWTISKATSKEFPDFTLALEIPGLGNFSAMGVLPKFSGTVRYVTQFLWNGSEFGDRHFVDLRQVYEIASIQINGRELGACIAPPYRLEVTSALQIGLNNLQIDVTNTLAKQYGDNAFDRVVAQEPSGLFGPVQLYALSRKRN